MVLGSCRSRRVAVCGSSRWWRTTFDSNLDVGRPQAQPGADLDGEFGTDDAVVAAAALADVVAQRAEHQQIGP